MKFVPVPGTDILMSVWETRVQDYAAFAKANPGTDMEWKDYSYGGHDQGPDHPVVNVSWEDARAFCAWLGRKEGRKYRLPTDHEWSLAVGIGEKENPLDSPADKDMELSDVYPWGTQWPPPDGAGNYCGEETELSYAIGGYKDDFSFTAPVGSFSLEHHGIKDLSGNAWEWVEDQWEPNSSSRVLRGGSWDDGSRDDLLSSYRNGSDPTNRSNNIGFRCVLSGVEAR